MAMMLAMTLLVSLFLTLSFSHANTYLCKYMDTEHINTFKNVMHF